SPFTTPVKEAGKHPNPDPRHPVHTSPWLINLVKPPLEERLAAAAESMAYQGPPFGSPSPRPVPRNNNNNNAPSAIDESEEMQERIRDRNQFDMPTEPVDPSFFSDMLPPSHFNFNFNLPPHRPGSASAELFRTRPLPRPPHQGAAGARPTGELQKKRSYPSSLRATDEAEEVFDALCDPDYRQGPATKSSRGHPRTRFHNFPGSTGVPHGQQRGTSRVTIPIVHHSALRVSDPDARATSHVRNLPPEPASCNECPQFWEAVASFSAFESLEEYEEEGISHSPPLKPCSETEKHGTEPYYVCSACRVRGVRHRTKHFNELSKQPRWLSLCDNCATYGLEAVAKPGDVENGILKKMGCSCGSEWMCFECALLEMEIAKVNYETERDFRRGLVGVGVLDDSRCAWTSQQRIQGGLQKDDAHSRRRERKIEDEDGREEEGQEREEDGTQQQLVQVVITGIDPIPQDVVFLASKQMKE
ncbi:MAG: hypothetical protein Q9216_002396, partial [Gyalolechia sp. 2 TL-2023]